MNARCTFVPRLEPLEDRCLLSNIFFGNGGIVAQVGAAVDVFVANRTLSTTVIVEDGRGDMAVAVNGGPFNIFTGVNTVNVAAVGRENAVVLFALAPLQAAEQVSLRLFGNQNAFLEHLPPGGAPLTIAAHPSVPIIQF